MPVNACELTERARVESNARRDDDLGLNMSLSVVQADVYCECSRDVCARDVAYAGGGREEHLSSKLSALFSRSSS